MRIYVIRHGQSEANLLVAHAGWSQVPLTEKGVAQAVAAGKRLEGLHFDKIIASDTHRAQQTVQNALPGREYVTDSRLREISTGVLEGRRVADCAAELGEPYDRARITRDFTLYGGENWQMIRSRVSEFMDEMAKEPEDAQIAVFCHEGSANCMLCHVMECQLPRITALADNCSISVFTYKNGKWIVNKWNETGNVVPEAK